MAETAVATPKVIEEGLDDVSDNEPEPVQQVQKPLNMSGGAVKLRKMLNRPLMIEMTDKRVLVGIFLCTDRDANVILGSCSEYLPESETSGNEEPRMLGLIMVPGKHIVNISIDKSEETAAAATPDPNEDVIV